MFGMPLPEESYQSLLMNGFTYTAVALYGKSVNVSLSPFQSALQATFD
jgi:hypothetical protein